MAGVHAAMAAGRPVAEAVYIVGTGWTTATNQPTGVNLISPIPTMAANGSGSGWLVDANSTYNASTDTFTTTNAGSHLLDNLGNPTLAAGTYEFGFLAKLGTMTTPCVSIYSTSLGDILASMNYAARINSGGHTRLRFRFTIATTQDVRVYPVRDSGTSGTVFVDSGTVSLRLM